MASFFFFPCLSQLLHRVPVFPSLVPCLCPIPPSPTYSLPGMPGLVNYSLFPGRMITRVVLSRCKDYKVMVSVTACFNLDSRIFSEK